MRRGTTSYPNFDPDTMKRIAGIFLLVTSVLLLSCKEEKPADDFTKDTYIATFGAKTRTEIGNSGLYIDLPSTHAIEEIKGDSFVIYSIISIDTKYNKGKAGVYHELHVNPGVPDTAWSLFKAGYNGGERILPRKDGRQVYIWSATDHPVEAFNLGKVMTSISEEKEIARF